MGLHHITWRATASGVADENLIADAVSWLVGDSQQVEIEQTTSYHGSEVFIVTGRCKKKSDSLLSLARLGKENLRSLIEDIDQRFDESHTLHFRIELDSLIDGEMVLGQPGKKPTIKAHTKVEVYPGQDPKEECEKVLLSAIEKSETHFSDADASI